MMLEAFLKAFAPDPAARQGADDALASVFDPDLKAFFAELGGMSFGDGLYRTAHPADQHSWTARVALAFPDYEPYVACFGFDWLGRVFALDSRREQGGRPGVVMFEPGTGQALEIPCNLGSFHDDELLVYADAALARDFFAAWRSAGGGALAYDQCAGYRKPLFLGGADNLSNIERSNIDVYWHLMGQLIAKVRNLPLGTRVDLS